MIKTKNPRMLEIFSKYQATAEELGAKCVLFFRMGEFYGAFFANAEKAAEILGMHNLCQRAGVPMCGFPRGSYDMSIEKFVRNGLSVAICENF